MAIDDLLSDTVKEKLVTASYPYLVTGSHAAFQYHHWLSPTPGVTVLRVYEMDTSRWLEYLEGEKVCAFPATPTTRQVAERENAVVLRGNLEPVAYSRRQIKDGICYEPAEDLCIGLLVAAKGQSSLSEVVAILVAQRERLDWKYLIERATASDQAASVGILAELVNQETGRALIPVAVIERLRRQAQRERVSGIFPLYRQRRPTWRSRKNMPISTYPETSARWKVPVALPGYVVGKVVFDLRPHWAEE